ncbi:MAG: peroxiredoxin [Rhodospirillales bacterium]|jgi:peroxiredoxin|nr:peroxiredoxin [Rhodospirillaceae bacterium]MDP6426384.1 peroxiredoxin [Rhodospirillales bacterium]MDP6642708.1 peroxiredoxin [Rhodospirillales bacterium]MDP6841676.1 peroxiredoxin [Rhodospirillales bacterium]|tara:strand:- start:1075 stop:1557 length:483 start_codon:yes stop_codon:yes gene_type:complete
MTISVGDRIPGATLRYQDDAGIQQVGAEELFLGKTVVLFGLPGAFTPTCSAKHLPGYVQNAGAISAKGVDSIICVAVNDAFVMAAWGADQNVGGKVMMVADGNAEFARALGLDFDASGPGLGTRCQRFSMLVENGVVKTLNIEEPGAFEISSAEAMLAQL